MRYKTKEPNNDSKEKFSRRASAGPGTEWKAGVM
jgi:hypothetical protein